MKHRATCSICEALCGLIIETEGEAVVSIRGDQDDKLSRGHICPKAVALQDLYTDPDRLRTPVRKEGDAWVPISWEEALSETAAKLCAIQDEHGRNSIGSYVGNPNAHHYGNILSGVELHRAIGSRNRFSATSADQLPHMFAAFHMFGHQLMMPIPDIDRTEFMVIIGGNPLVSNGSIMTAPDVRTRLASIKERGGSIVVVDPRRTETAEFAGEHIAIQPGTDAMWLAAVIQTVFEEGLVNHGTWRDYTNGLARLREALRHFTPEAVANSCGVAPSVTRDIARRLASCTRACVYARLGACTQEFGGLSAWLAYALNLITGHLDTPGGLMFTNPAVDILGLARGISQAGHFDAWRSRVSNRPEFGGELPVSVMAEEMETPGTGQIRALVTVAGNPVLSAPNGARIASAIDKLDFVVCIDMYITATSSKADIILPPVSPLERDHYGIAFHNFAVRNTSKYTEAVFSKPEDGKEDWEIMVDLARRIQLHKNGRQLTKKTAVLETLNTVGPKGVLSMLMSTGPYGAVRNPLGHRLTLNKLLKTPGGIDLGPLRPNLPGRLNTADKRIALAPEPLVEDLHRLERAMAATTPDTLRLIGRRHLRSNNTWLHNSKRLMRGKPRCTLLMHPDDAESRGISDGDLVQIASRTGAVATTVEVSDEVRTGVVSLPHGWGHKQKGAKLGVANEVPGVSVNDVTDDKFYDELTGNAALNGVPVEVSLPN